MPEYLLHEYLPKLVYGQAPFLANTIKFQHSYHMMNNTGTFLIIWLQFYVYYSTNAETNCSKCMHCTIGNICTPKDYDKFVKPFGKTIVNVGIRDMTILKVVMDWLTKFGFYSVLRSSIK